MNKSTSRLNRSIVTCYNRSHDVKIISILHFARDKPYNLKCTCKPHQYPILYYALFIKNYKFPIEYSFVILLKCTRIYPINAPHNHRGKHNYIQCEFGIMGRLYGIFFVVYSIFFIIY